MRKLVKGAAFALWILIASCLLTGVWLRHSAYFPQFPPTWAEYLASAYGVRNAEDIADLEILLGLSMSIPLVVCCTLAGLRLFRWWAGARSAS